MLHCFCMVKVVMFRMITTLDIAHNGYTSLVSSAKPFAPAEEESVWPIYLEGVIQVLNYSERKYPRIPDSVALCIS